MQFNNKKDKTIAMSAKQHYNAKATWKDMRDQLLQSMHDIIK